VKKFAFRLQRVLKLREANEKLKLGEFGREQQKLMDEQTRLRLFEGERDFQLHEVRTARQKEFSVWSQGNGCRYLQRIGRVVEFQSMRVEDQQQSVLHARQIYLDARRDTRVLEMLREKKREEWQVETLLEEGKVLDEIGSRKPDGEES
jgi:flagellar FliJ protein